MEEQDIFKGAMEGGREGVGARRKRGMEGWREREARRDRGNVGKGDAAERKRLRMKGK